MRKILFAALLVAAIIFAGSLLIRDPAASEDYALAEARIVQAIAEDERVLMLNDLPALDRLPPEVAELHKLIQLNLNNTNVADIGPVAGLTALRHLNMRDTRVRDLSPITGLPELLIVDLDESWVADLSPLVTLPKLRRIGLGDTQILSLEPATRIRSLEWINLHGSYAVDGSRDHYETLHRNDVAVNNGRAYQQDYRPDWIFRSKVRFGRLLERLGLKGRD